MAVGEREGLAVAISSQRSEVIVSQVIGCSADEGGVVMGGWKMERRSFDEATSLPIELLSSRKRSESLHGHKCFTLRPDLTPFGSEDDLPARNRLGYFQKTRFDGSKSRDKVESAAQRFGDTCHVLKLLEPFHFERSSTDNLT